nr:uncharacterized protein LOC124809762 [Hydra vulgaris]
MILFNILNYFKIFLLLVHTKFEINTGIQLRFVLESDGCEIDPEDFPFVLRSDTSIIVLQPNEKWNEKREIQTPIMEASAGGTDTLHRSNITDAITPSFHLTNNEVTQTPSNSASGVFTSQTSLESFLLQHSKSKQHMLRLKTVGYGIALHQLCHSC